MHEGKNKSLSVILHLNSNTEQALRRVNQANHCSDCCTTNNQRMGLDLWKRLQSKWILVLNDISNPESQSLRG